MSGMPEFKTVVKDVSAEMRGLRESQPDLMAAFSQLAAAGTKEGALSKKTREMIALGIAVAGRCDDCIGFHIQALIKLGTTRTELEEVLGTAVYMGGGPSMMYATHALAAFDEFSS